MPTACRAFAVLAVLATSSAAGAAPVPVKLREGVTHGYLLLKDADGKVIADGDLVEVPKGREVHTRLVFQFRDGSVQDEKTVFTQDRVLRLERYHLVQRGPAFPKALDVTLDRRARRVVVKHRSEGKEEEVDSKTLDEFPADLANGMVFSILKNLSADAGAHSGPSVDGREGAGRAATGEATVHMLAFTPKPEMVKLEISGAPGEGYAVGVLQREALGYTLHVDIHGIKGVMASLLGKDPPDFHVWLQGGDAPSFLAFEGPLYVNGPIWRMELGGAPSWPGRAAAAPTAPPAKH